MVVQLGLATMFLGSECRSPGFTSGTTRGTSSSIRNADRCASACGGQCDINVFKIIVVFKFLHGKDFTLKFILLAGTTCGSKQYKFIQRELPFLEHTKEFLSYGSAYTYYCYFHFLSNYGFKMQKS
jgi:hypothetical protein